MFQRYKEIFFGLAFGILAVIIDTAMDSIAEGNSYVGELSAHPIMMLYRSVFILLGLGLGYLLWQRNRNEREVRRLTEAVRRIQQQIETQGLLLRSTLQTLLLRDDLSSDAQRLLQEAYHRTQEFQRIAEEKLPVGT
jgi:hypothetical protein